MSEFKITNEVKKPISWKLVVIFILFTASIIVTGVYYYKSQRTRIFAEQENTLHAISTLKVNQIQQWYKERIGDANVISETEPLIHYIINFFKDENQSGSKREVEKWMESVNENYEYGGVLLIDTKFKVRLSAQSSDTVVGVDVREELQEVMRKKNIVFTDLQKSTSLNNVHFDLIIPLIEPGHPENKAFGVVILRIDPSKSLFPLIQSWPTSSKSSETLLVRREGDSVIYLNELRHQKNTPLNFRLPLSNRDLLATKAVSGLEGVIEGMDYRNIAVVGYSTSITCFPWHMVAKVDKEEIQKPLKRYFFMTVIIIFLLILINGSVFWFWIRDQRVKMYQLRLIDEITINESKEKLLESEELFRKLFENMLNGFAYCKMIFKEEKPFNFIYLKVNDAFESLTGLKNVEGRNVSDVIPGILEADPELMERYGRVAQTGIPEVFDMYVESLKMWFSISVYSPEKEYFVALFDVITARKMAEAALRVSEERYRNFFNSLIEGFCIIEMVFDTENKPVDYRFIEINSSFEHQTGLRDVKGRLMSDIAPDNEQFWYDVYGKVALTGDPVRFESEAKALNRWFEVSASRLEGPINMQVAIYFNDITERKKGELALRESEDKFKYVFDHSVIGKSITFPDGEIHVNRSFCDMIGYSAEELNRTKWQDISHPDDIEESLKAVDDLVSGEKDSVRFIKRYLHKNGTTVWADVGTSLRRDLNGKPLYFMTIVNDITDRVKAEEALHKLNNELELRVSQRTEQVEAVNKELEAFSYSVSHDLRAPLRSVHGFTKILLEDYQPKLDEEGKRICGIIISSANQMGELIDDLLSFSRIGRTNLNPSVIDMKKMVKVLFEGMASPAEQERIKFKVSKLHNVYGDVKLLGQVWTNLISNAIKYTSKNANSEILIGSDITGNEITYYIKDNGVGFDRQYSHKLFGVFQRLHGESEFEGNGVGLAIIKRIILKHDGKVWAEGEVGKGATFYFSLPVSEV